MNNLLLLFLVFFYLAPPTIYFRFKGRQFIYTQLETRKEEFRSQFDKKNRLKYEKDRIYSYFNTWIKNTSKNINTTGFSINILWIIYTIFYTFTVNVLISYLSII